MIWREFLGLGRCSTANKTQYVPKAILRIFWSEAMHAQLAALYQATRSIPLSEREGALGKYTCACLAVLGTCAGSSRPRTRAKPPPQSRLKFAIEEARQKSYNHDHSAHGPLFRPMGPYSPGEVYLRLPGCARACSGSSRPRTRAKPPPQIEFNLRLRRLGRRATTMTIQHTALSAAL